MYTLNKRSAILALTFGVLLASASSAYAQTADATIRVDISNSSLNPPNFGQNGWDRALCIIIRRILLL